MDENMIFRNKNRNYEDKLDRMLDNYAEMTASKMKTYDQFRQQQFREQQEENGFTLIEEQKDEFYSTDRVKENVLMIDELMDHAEALQLTGAQKEDLNIRRNRIKDFELLNDKTKEDSDKMTRVKEEIRQYDVLLSMAPKSLEEYQTFCMLAKEKCEDVIQSCNEYLKRGKSLRFWRSDRNDRFHMVEEAKERFLKDQDIFSTLSELTDTEKFLRPDDTMLDLMNLEAINERLVAYDAAQRQEQEEDQLLEEELKRMEEELDDQEEWEERAEGVNEFFAGAEEQAEDQLLEEELKRMEEELDDQEEGYKQAEGVNDLFIAEEKRLQREEKRQAGENQAENVGEFFADAGEEYQEQKKEEEYEYEEGDSFEEILAEEQEQYQEQKKEEEYEYEEGDSFEEIPAEEQEQYQKEHQEEAERQRQAEEERQRKEAEERQRKEAEERQRKEAEERQRKEAEERQRKEAEERQRKEEEERQHKEAEKAERKRQEEEARRAEQQQQEQQKFGYEELAKMGDANTPEMQAVKTAIIEIQAKMAQQMPKVAVSEDKAADQKAERRARKQEVDKFCANMIRSFNKLSQSIDKCLKKEGGAGYQNSDALKGILTHLQEYTKADRTLFKDKVVSYRAWLGENPDEANKEHTWSDAWKYVRSVAYNLDDVNNGFKIKTVGAGASYITRIRDTKKKQTVYFRKNENVGDKDADAFVTNFMNVIKGDINCPNNVKEALENQFKALFTDQVYRRDSVQLADKLDIHRYYGDDYVKNLQDFVNHNADSCLPEFKEVFNQASDQVKVEMGKALKFFAKKCYQFSWAKDYANIPLDQSLTDRNVATSRLAAALGISSMVSDSRTAVIKKDGKEIMGNVMEESRGKEIKRVDGDWTYSNKAISQSFTLQVFDILCGQIDRHYGNFHVITKEKDGKKVVNSIKAIDNDMAFGAILPNGEMYNGCQNMCPLTECHIRSMPINVINSILKMDKDALQELIGDLVSPGMIECAVDRLKFIQNAIRTHAQDGQSNLKIKENGEAAFEGEDADDELRMLKAVKDFHTGGDLRWYNGENIAKRNRYDYGEFNKEMTSLIDWDHLKDLDDRINDARTAWQNKQKK